VKGDKTKEEQYEIRLANRIAEEILSRSKALRHIHSKHSIQKIIGNEARKFLKSQNVENNPKHPRLYLNKEHNKEHIQQISRAPNLYRNPAI